MIVYTPLGKGKVVFKLRDGSYLVEFDHGGGHIFLAEELFPRGHKPALVEEDVNYAKA